ncbi:hypothetical protein H4R19_005575, partial [Coemansia spiralis]
MAHFAPYSLPAQTRNPPPPPPGYSAAVAPPDPTLHDSLAAYARMPASSHAHSQAHLPSISAQQPAAASMHYAAAQQLHQPRLAPAMVSPAHHYHPMHAQHIFAPVPGAPPAAAAPVPSPVQLWMGDIEAWMDDEH